MDGQQHAAGEQLRQQRRRASRKQSVRLGAAGTGQFADAEMAFLFTITDRVLDSASEKEAMRTYAKTILEGRVALPVSERMRFTGLGWYVSPNGAVGEATARSQAALEPRESALSHPPQVQPGRRDLSCSAASTGPAARS